jgi:nicotinamide-nucleotide amidase
MAAPRGDSCYHDRMKAHGEIRAEFLATGSELLGPHKSDRNSLFLAGRLLPLGIRLARKSVVPDDMAGIARALREAARRADILVVSGGLGPTADDLTAEAAGRAFRRPLVFDEKVFSWMRAYLPVSSFRFKVSGKKPSSPETCNMKPETAVAANLRKQALVPKGFEPLRNRLGTAPGLWGVVEAGKRKCAVAVLPGVPYEFDALLMNEVEPRLKKRFPKRPAVFAKTLLLAEMRESDFDDVLRRIPLERGVETGDAVSPGVIRLHFSAPSRAALRGQARRFRAAFGSAVFGEDNATLESAVGERLKKRRATLAVGESCTGGLLAERLTRVAGSSAYFAGGVVAYSPRAKERLLGVPAKLIRKHGVVSEAAALAMARGARGKFGADYALAVTGVAGPSGGTKKNPVGTVWMALASPRGAEAWKARFEGDRAAARERAASSCLNRLRLALSGKG